MVSKSPNTFEKYLSRKSKLDLVSDWTDEDLAAIKKSIKKLSKSVVGEHVEPGKTNQSTGNKFEKFLAQTIQNSKTLGLNLWPSKGQGYPDLVLKSTAISAFLCLEVKTTSKWNSNDSNRRVLMSSVNRLTNVRKSFPMERILHLICTIEYDSKTFTITGLQFHFLRPSSPVGFREEISTSQKSLASGSFDLFIS